MKFDLKTRIIFVITSLSLLFVSSFTYIQVKNQLDRLADYNRYKARVGAVVVKTSLEMLIKNSPEDDSLQVLLQAALESLVRGGFVERMSVLTADGRPLATNDPIVEEFGESKGDMDAFMRLPRTAEGAAWFFSAVNEKTQMTEVYIPLVSGSGRTYVIKLSFSMANVGQAMGQIALPIALTVIVVILGNIALGAYLARTVVRPLRILNIATKDLASGRLDLKVRIGTNDEIEELSSTFNDMTEALKKMKKIAEDANPLTKLPGNNIIREVVESKIRSGEPFTAIHVDLDNFKAYNDHYGIGKGDEVIIFTASVLTGAVNEGSPDGGFIGHEGGDDFFVIVPPQSAEAVAAGMIAAFDAGIASYYREDDRSRGYIIEKDRKGQTVHFPIMTISLAGVTNQHRPISSYAELSNIAVDVKRKAKAEGRSNYVIDKRTV